MGGARKIAWMALCLVGRLSAQVGHDPGSSPYHDIRRGAVLRLVGGYLSGSRGKLSVGPSDGATGGLRLEYQASSVLVLTTGIAVARTDAFFITAYDTVPRKVGPVRNDLVLTDAGLQLSLSGGKTVHGFQPYVGGAIGLAFGSTIGADTSGYLFGTKFTYGPEVGVRWYPTRRVTVELGGRVVYYKLQYPLSYKLYAIPVTAPLSEWTAHPWATAGVAWTF